MGFCRYTLLPLGLTLLLATGACTKPPDTPSNGSSETPATVEAPVPPAVEPSGGTEPIAATEVALALSTDGLQFVDPADGSTTSFVFGTAMDPVQRAVTRLYGTPQESALNEECPGGPLTITTWSNGLALNAKENSFVGWSVRPQTASATLTTMAGIGIGSSRSDLEAAYTADVFESSLGVEFFVGPLAGLLSSPAPDATITDLWAGEVCIFR